MYGNRREFVRGAACCAALSVIPHGVSAQSEEALGDFEDEDEYFVCGTIVDATAGGLEIRDFGAGESFLDFRQRVANDFAITDFGTAVAKLRWRPEDGLTPNTGVVTLGCSFLSGSRGQQEDVQQAANDWLQGSVGQLIRFDFSQPPQKAQVRFAIGRGQGYWTQPGRSALQIAHNQPTCRLAGTGGRNQKKVLHELGHIFGLRHEHLNPTFNVQFNEPVVIADMAKAPNRWTPGQTRDFILTRFGPEGQCIGDPDLNPGSIMMYDIPPAWTMTGQSFTMATQISARDRQCVAGLYSRG